MDEKTVHLERYYPNVLAPAKEFKTIAAAENPELNLLWQRLWKWYRNTFVYELDVQGAARWESMLNIRPKITDTLDERRIAILVKINTMLPYTYRRMEQILNVLCGEGKYGIDLNHVAGELYILTNPDITLNINKIVGVLRPIIPANLAMWVTLNIFLRIKIHHRAEITQFVDARHNIWNLGSISTVRRDGEFNRDGTTRRTGKHPDENYRDRQSHRAEIDLLVESTLTGSRMVNSRDGTHRRDGSCLRNGTYKTGGMISHACTITTIKNGIEVIEYV